MHYFSEQALLLSPLASYQSLFAKLYVCLEHASTTSMLFALRMIDSEGANVTPPSDQTAEDREKRTRSAEREEGRK